MNSKRQSKTSGVIPASAEKGFVLIAVIMLLIILALIGTVAVITTTTEIKISGNYKTRTQSFYIAEAGVHRAIGMLNDATTDWIGGLTEDELATNVFPGGNSLGNGTYIVTISKDDPTLGSVRINSTGSATTSSSTVEAIVTLQYYDILNYGTFDCGDLVLKEGETNKISGGDVFVSGNLDLEATGNHQIQDGDVYVMGNININGISSITGGNAFANGNINVLSSVSPTIDGNATAGGVVSGSVGWEDKVSGNVSDGVSAPVTNQCSGTNLSDITITSDVIQGFRDNATTTISGDYTFDSGHNYTGIVHITGNFELTGNETFSGNVIFIVDGNANITGSLNSNPPGSNITFLVPTGNFDVKGGGNFTIDGTLLVGTVDPDGNNITGGNISIVDGSNLTVNGNVIAINGNTDTSSGGAFTVNYQSPNDSNLMEPNSYKMTQWREIRN